jgi:hypothetical protein
MIRTFITPNQSNFNFTIDLPQDYLGQELELIVFKKQEGLIIEKPKSKMSDFIGIITENDYQDLKINIEESKKNGAEIFN